METDTREFNKVLFLGSLDRRHRRAVGGKPRADSSPGEGNNQGIDAEKDLFCWTESRRIQKQQTRFRPRPCGIP